MPNRPTEEVSHVLHEATSRLRTRWWWVGRTMDYGKDDYDDENVVSVATALKLMPYMYSTITPPPF